jgi:ribosome biogenesis GTPase A
MDYLRIPSKSLQRGDLSLLFNLLNNKCLKDTHKNNTMVHEYFFPFIAMKYLVETNFQTTADNAFKKS